MSSIEQIIKIERESASRLEASKKEAESIKNTAREEAGKIIDAAKLECKVQTERILNSVNTQTTETEKKIMTELNEKLHNKQKLFDQKCDGVADWIVEQIIG